MKKNRQVVFDRQQKIIDLVNARKEVSVEELSAELAVSVMTIRRDLQYLENRSLLQRVHGGAVCMTDGLSDSNRGLVEVCRTRISEYASDLIRDGDRIFINGSRMALDMLDYVGDRCVEVFTNNGYAIGRQFPDGVSLTLIGGRLHGKIMVGEYAMRNLVNISASRAFIGCAAVHPDGKFSYAIPTEIGLTEIMLTRTEGEVYVLADHTKFRDSMDDYDVYGGSRYVRPVTLITDSLVSEKVIASLRNNNIEVVQVEV